MRSTARSLRRNRDEIVPGGARARPAEWAAHRVARVPVTALLAALAAALSAASPPWALPVHGPVAAGFRYDPARPFAAGARRGVDLRAAARSPVRAACSGRVTHAGAVPRWAVASACAAGASRPRTSGCAGCSCTSAIGCGAVSGSAAWAPPA
jgi:murein DD-endopeptidase MepM/ murein hydrolase activator NlpD